MCHNNVHFTILPRLLKPLHFYGVALRPLVSVISAHQVLPGPRPAVRKLPPSSRTTDLERGKVVSIITALSSTFRSIKIRRALALGIGIDVHLTILR
jgi:hypothetical protein